VCARLPGVHRLLSALLLLVLAAPLRAAEEEIVTVRLAWEPGTIGSISAGRIPFQADPPPGIEALPGLRIPRYARIRMADSKGLLVALDADEDNVRLWVDHDVDGDLNDEREMRFEASGKNGFRRVEILAPYADEKEPVPVTLHFSHMRTKAADFVSVFARIHRRGTVVLGGRLRFVALTDHSFDAGFEDARDRIYLDLNGDGRYQVAGAAPEQITAGKPFRVGNEGWVARVTSRSGRAIEFTRSKTVPPAPPRPWVDTNRPTAGTRRTPPKETLKVLRARFETERKKSYGERTATIGLLGDVGTKESGAFLLDTAGSDPDRNVKLAALRALGNPAYLETAGDRVLALAKKATSAEAYSLAQALHQMGHPDREQVYLRMIESADASAVGGAAKHLAYMDSARGRGRILALVEESGTPAVRQGAYFNGARNLKGGPPPALILHAAEDAYIPLRAQAIRDLGALEHPDARRQALALAAERPVNVTAGQAVAEILGAAGDARAVAAMLALFDDPKLHAQVRKKVLDQLRFLRAPDAIAQIVKALKSDNPAVRAVAAEVLAGIPEPQVTKALLKRAKKEKDPEIQALLLEALGDHGHESALPLLLKQARSRKKGPARASAVRALARLGFHHAKVRAFLLALLDSRDADRRILALDAAGAAGDATVMPKILPNLAHDRWQVRLAAVEALDHLRPRAAIEPLIAHLGREDVERVRDAAAGALFRLTGMNLYDDAGIWRRWWAEHGEGFQVPEAIPTMPEQHVGGTQAGFYGIPVKSERVVFVIDQSGSMSASGGVDSADDKKTLNRLDVAVREVLGAVAKLKSRARVNVILFHTTIHPWKDSVQKLSGANRGALKRHLESKKPTGGTNLYDGLELALRARDVDTIFLLSDGVPGSGKYVATPDILRGVRRENQTRRIAIHCISIGMDSDLLRRIAQENGGRYVRR